MEEVGELESKYYQYQRLDGQFIDFFFILVTMYISKQQFMSWELNWNLVILGKNIFF